MKQITDMHGYGEPDDFCIGWSYCDCSDCQYEKYLKQQEKEEDDE